MGTWKPLQIVQHITASGILFIVPHFQHQLMASIQKSKLLTLNRLYVLELIYVDSRSFSNFRTVAHGIETGGTVLRVMSVKRGGIFWQVKVWGNKVID